VAGSPPPRLDLSEPRTYNELLRTTWQVFAGHAGVFLTLALVLVAPATLIVDGIWGRALADGIDAKPPLAAETVSAALRVLVILPIVTAANVLIVQGLGEGREPSVGGALRASARVFPRVLGAVVIYAIVSVAGVIAFVIPGVWFAIRCYFAAQAVVVEDLRPTAALRRSSGLVRGVWWRTFAYVVVTGLLFGLGGSLVIALVGSTGSPGLYVSALMIVGAAAVSLTAIFATLLFFDLRARRAEPDARMAG
jgi:hypothetical protein